MKDIDQHYISTDEYAVKEFIRAAEQAKKLALALAKDYGHRLENKAEYWFMYPQDDLDAYWQSSKGEAWC